MPFGIGPGELIIVLIIALIVVGPGKLPDVGSALGKSIREFRKASTDVKEITSLEAPEAAPAPAAAPVAAAPAAVVAAEPVAPAPMTEAVADPTTVAAAPVVAAEPVAAESGLAESTVADKQPTTSA